MPLIDVEDLMEDEHLKAVGMFHHMEHPSEGPTVLVNSPVNYSKTPSSIRRPAPRFGENGPEILAEYGYDEATINGMAETGALITEDEG